MPKQIAIVGAGVSGLTCGVLLAELGHRVSTFAGEIGQQTTSAAAGAIWYPYDAEPADKVIPWALETYTVFVDLGQNPQTGVSMLELRSFSRAGKIQIPDWAHALGARPLVMSSEYASPARTETSLTINSSVFNSAFTMKVPLTDTTVYLDYLAQRFRKAGGAICANVRFEQLADVDPAFDLVINCAGIGAKKLVPDADLESHRGQVAIVPKIDNLPCAIVCDDAPLMYAIPRGNDCVFGGTNDLSEDRHVDPAATARIVAECSRVLNIDTPKVLAERVGLRPFRKSGVRLERDKLHDGRTLIHNYGHGGAGFTLSWGCAREVLDLANHIR
ncbi:MAG: D-amino-acid oxidase [Verrucomicrobiota bacterium]